MSLEQAGQQLAGQGDTSAGANGTGAAANGSGGAPAGAATAAASQASAGSLAAVPSGAASAAAAGGTAPATQTAAGAGAAPGSTGAAAQQQVAMQSLRDVVREFGAGDLATQFSDDTALVQHLLLSRQQAQQAQELARYGQQVLPHYGEFQQFLAQKQAQAQAQQTAQQKPWWSEYWQPPEFNPAWEKQIHRDAQGHLVAAPGAPPDIVQKFTQYQAFRQQQADRLMQNPFEFFEKPITALAQRIAQGVVQQHLGSYQDQLFARQFAADNAAWLWQKDPQGQPLRDPSTGQPALTDEGRAFRGYVIEAADTLGIRDVQGQQRYALGMTQRDYALKQLGQAQGQQGAGNAGGAAAQQQAAGEQAKQLFLAGATRRPNQAGSVRQPNGDGAIPAQNQSLPLAERLRRNFVAAGVTDQQLQ